MPRPAVRLEAAIRERLAPELRRDGFKGTGLTFRRVVGDWIQVVNVQGSTGGRKFAINLGMHPVGLPDEMGDVPDPARITESGCDLRRRLSDSESRSDMWWTHEATAESMARAVAEATAVYIWFGRPMLNRVAAAAGDPSRIRALQFAEGDFDFGGFGAPRARMALMLARLREREGALEEAAAFGAQGLAEVGNYAALREDLAGLVRRCTDGAMKGAQ